MVTQNSKSNKTANKCRRKITSISPIVQTENTTLKNVTRERKTKTLTSLFENVVILLSHNTALFVRYKPKQSKQREMSHIRDISIKEKKRY